MCENTYDKIFLLSSKEIVTYNHTIPVQGTDYAKIQRLYAVNSNKSSLWWSRSPANSADEAKEIMSGDSTGFCGYLYRWSRIGVRPACWVKL